jgi:hypothetical protein
MIFGFNTDIKHEGTVYHVQSEARQQETLLQTQVFLRGRCIGKRASHYGDRATTPGFAEAQIEQLLREQHKLVSDAVKEGRLESVLDKHETPESLAAVRQLDLQWVNTNDVFPDSELVLRLVVTDAGVPASGVKLVSRVNLVDQKASFSDATTDSQGAAEMKFTLDEAALSEASILVQANHAGRTATRKFSFRKSME